MGKIVRMICWVIAAVMIMGHTAPAVYASQVKAVLTYAYISVNGGYSRYAVAYNIENYKYIRLRDIAELLNGSPSQFNVVWRSETAQNEILTRTPYVLPEAEKKRYASQNVKATPMSVALLVDGQSYYFPCYNIDNNNYFRIADLADVLGFHISWREADDINYIETFVSDNIVRVWRPNFKSSMGMMDRMVSTSTYASVAQSYIFEYGTNIQTLDVDTQYNAETEQHNNNILVETFDADFKRLASKSLEFEGEMFGGFFAGNEYNYLVFGNSNMEENDSKEVIRIVKYSKNFARLGAISVKDCYTTEPFRCGNPSMAEYGNTLVLHASRLRYLTDDGLRHESQLTVIADTQKMSVINADSLGRFQANHVSHSFNQFVEFDGSSHVLIDHGDAYPRSVVLNKSEADGKYKEIDLLKIPGTIGSNYTGVTVGGFEVTGTSYVTAVNSVNFKNNVNTERDLLILSVPKNNLSNDSVNTVKLTDFSGKSKFASRPYLVKTGNNELVVLWEEFDVTTNEYGGEIVSSTSGVKWAKLDGSGNLSGTVNTVENISLSGDCQPIYKDGKIIWYIDAPTARLFFVIDL